MDETLPPGAPETLEAALADAWQHLLRGVADRRSPFHLPCLTSLGLDGSARARVVVLRAADPEGRLLRIHTDRRSAKVAEIARDPRVGLTAYDPVSAVQVRVEGRAALHADDAVADAAWAASRPVSRVCYGEAPAPGTPLAAADAYSLPADEAAVAAGRAHFCAVTIAVERLEWLHLAHRGHRRAGFAFAGGNVQGTWLAP